MSIVLKLEHVTKRFSGLVAVNDLSLTMEERTIHSLIGPNGSGKSTTVNMISGALSATEGQIWHEDTRIDDFPAYKVARTGMSRTFQNLKLFSSMTVLENLMVGMHAHATQRFLPFIFNFSAARKEEHAMREQAKTILDAIGMYHLKDEYVNNLSYGRQKMTELGRSLMNQPKLLLLDEPAAGLNPSERVEFVNILIKVFESGVDLFLIEHNMDVVMNISHTVTVINFGSKIAEGKPKEIQESPAVIKAYLGDRYKQNMAKGGEGIAKS